MTQHWLAGLNPAQVEAATYGEGPVLVVAGAGTGKTKTLAARVAHLIHAGVPAYRILLLTFTRRAAAEMLHRAEHMAGPGTTGKVWGGTFHAIANRLLRMYGRAVDLPPDFTVMDQADAADLMNLIRNSLKLGSGERRFPQKQTLVSIHSRAVNSREKLAKVLKVHFPWCQDDIEGIRAIFEEYDARKHNQFVLDYDDLLLHWNALCQTDRVGDIVGDRFEHILVDEYQDTNAVQAEILQNMRRAKRNIMVVGDDAQSIYSFRAATVRNILDFPKEFPGTQVIKLEQNYRSTMPILTASNAVMAKAKERYTKELWSERESGEKPKLITCQDEPDQCSAVCDRILAHREEGIPLRRQAVLFRAGWHSNQLEVELKVRNIPFHKYGGLKFIEAAHVKDVLAFLRVLENPYDQLSWFRLLQLLEGVGPSTARKIMTGMGIGEDAGSRVPREEGAHASVPNGGKLVSGGIEALRGVGQRPGPDAVSPLVRLFENPPKLGAGASVQFRDLCETLADCSGWRRGKAARSMSASATLKDADGRPALPEPTSSRGPGKSSKMVAALAIRDGASTSVPNTPPSPLLAGGELAVPLPELSGVPTPAMPDDADEADSPRADEPPLTTQLERIRRFYEPIFQRVYENPAVRLRDLEQLEQIAGRYRSRRRFVADLTLDPPQSTSDLAGPPHLDEDYLILSTIHSAKGCEWDAVYVIHAADGMIPSDMALGDTAGEDEERRLFYVAMTRAKNHLYVLFPLRYYRRGWGLGDAHHYSQRTRFIHSGMLPLLEIEVAREPDEEAALRLGGRRQIRAYLNDLWAGNDD